MIVFSQLKDYPVNNPYHVERYFSHCYSIRHSLDEIMKHNRTGVISPFRNPSAVLKSESA